MAHYYGFKPRDIDRLTMSQVNMYLDETPMLEYRKAWPVAVMIAQQGNFSGGKSRKKPKKQSDTIPYKPEDFMPYLWFAQYEPYMELTGSRSEIDEVDIDALRELWERRNDISSMFFGSLDWRSIRERLGIVED